MPQPSEYQQYYISDKAYRNLVTMAQRQKYVKELTQRHKGMSEFVADLAYYEFKDTRPPNVIERHKQQIAFNRAPIWTEFAVRRVRRLFIPHPAELRYLKIARQVGIIRDEPWAIGGPSILKPIPIISYVLEGIGLGWITPTRLPVKRTIVD